MEAERSQRGGCTVNTAGTTVCYVSTPIPFTIRAIILTVVPALWVCYWMEVRAAPRDAHSGSISAHLKECIKLIPSEMKSLNFHMLMAVSLKYAIAYFESKEGEIQEFQSQEGIHPEMFL